MRSPLFSWGLLILATLLWALFGYLIFTLHTQKADFTKQQTEADAASLREDGATRLRATIQGTEIERAAIESIVGISILDTVETIEKAARDAGAADVKTSEASTLSTSAQKLSTVSVVMNASGSFASLMRAASLLETLPLPATVEQFEITKTDKTWRLTARLRVIIAAEK